MAVFRCDACGAPLPATEAWVVRCRHCDTDVHLLHAHTDVHRVIADLEARTLEAERISEEVRPLADAAREELELAVTEARNRDAVMALATLMRLEVASPQVMVPDFDYETEVVRPAVESFAESLEVELGDW